MNNNIRNNAITGMNNNSIMFQIVIKIIKIKYI